MKSNELYDTPEADIRNSWRDPEPKEQPDVQHEDEDDCWTRIGTPVVEHDVSAFAECVIKVMEITPIDWSKKLREEKSKNLFASRGKLNTEE